jgi:hypothetical protein
MARRIRIGFEAMSSYSDKDNRHRYQMFGDSEYLILEKAIKALLARAELRITDTTIKELETAE